MYGDSLMAIGDAWKLHREDPLRRKVAIGNGLCVDPINSDLGWGLDFLASQQDVDRGEPVNWVFSYPRHRPYIDYAEIEREAQTLAPWRRLVRWPKAIKVTGRFRFNPDYRVTPAPIRLRPEEEDIFDRWSSRRFVTIEPFIKSGAPPSKQWPVERFADVARALMKEVDVYQISAPDNPSLEGIPRIRSGSFRESLAYLKAAALHIGVEGGLHHGAAAMGTQAVVIFGGFASPSTTGYDFHVNLTGGPTVPCGTRRRLCPHCIEQLDRITVEEVLAHARKLLSANPVHRDV